jgi:pyruvate,water dikinase
VLGDPDDIFFLTIPEIGRRATQPIEEIVEARRRRHAEYEALTLPRTWTGMPDPIPIDRVTSTVDALTGVPVSAPATVEGRARVVTDPSSDDPLEADEILVCDATDPSWVSLFVSATALVIDIGGPLSHGAIVARELGIPAVVNTGDGTRAIRTGDRIRVDGKDGRIEILDRANTASPRRRREQGDPVPT